MQDKNRSLQSAEYTALYQEIQENTKSIYSVLSMCVTAFTAITSGIALIINGFFTNLTTVMTTQRSDLCSLPPIDYRVFFFPFLFFLPFLILLPSIIIVTSSLNSTVRIATYIQVFYENNNENDISWQTKMQEFRKRKSGFRVFSVSLRYLFRLIGFACIGFSLITEALVLVLIVSKNHQIYLTDAITVVITVVYFVSLILLVHQLSVLNEKMQGKWKSKYFDDLEGEWEKIKKNTSTTQ